MSSEKSEMEHLIDDLEAPYPELELVEIEAEQINVSDDKLKNVLIIEDDEYVAKDYGFMLEAYGYSVSYAFDSEQAIKMLYLHGNKFFLISIDIRMNYGRYFSFRDTVGGLRTGIFILKEAVDLCPDSIFIGLTGSDDAMNEAWFSANESAAFCEKNIYPSKRFAKLVHDISRIGLNEALALIVCKQNEARNQNNEPTINTYIEYQTVIKEKVMGDKYEAGQVGAQGPNAHVHDVIFNQVWEQNKNDIDLSDLSSQLVNVREALAEKASSSDDFIEIGHVASAQQAAEAGNGPKAIEFLKQTGNKTLETAEKIGVGVAIAAIKASMGL
ncbi:hypothetical protein BBM86_16640 [Vibrio parahaemolyticus]|uniref:response regulator n=1 Tax=Vibrio parahaemolyticus TaxID=670 RepID=UPI00084A8AFF|nr:response regulator [Vibrio parahaemolyticus]EJS4060771.1 response regulator [Vibrio parahaemolyticus]OEB79735.1 hypothetical protein BBM86_16640 [Vibrio parahaemolyticus]